MPESPKGKTTSPRAVTREPARDAARSDTIEPLQVRYFRRMSLQRVYGVVVGWPKRKEERRAPAGTPPVPVCQENSGRAFATRAGSAKRSFAVGRSQTEFGNEENEDSEEQRGQTGKPAESGVCCPAFHAGTFFFVDDPQN